MKQWLGNLFTGILGNLMTPLVAGILGALGLVLWVIFGNSPQTFLLLVLIALVLLDIILTAIVIARLRLLDSKKDGIDPGALKSIGEMHQILVQQFPPRNVELDPDAMALARRFVITDKRFDPEKRPYQRILLQFTNRGNEIIHIERVRFAGKDLPNSALAPSYTTDDGHYYIIQSKKTDVPPTGSFIVEVYVAQIWDVGQMAPLIGNWGYLKIDVINNNKQLTLFYAI